MPRRSALVIALALATSAFASSYDIVKQYQGSTFFDDWTFYNKFDNLTNGDVFFVSSKGAASDKLAFINGAGNAIMKVDNTSTVKFNDKRNSVRITSKDRFAVGSVWVVDMLHTPYGCSVWPGFWSTAPSWPSGGEIDTFEGVNQVTMNQMGLHTEPGCIQQNANQSSTLVNSTDCSFVANNNEGCITTNPSLKSYGADFASNGGGVWVTEYAQSGISIWFFERSAVPSSISSNASTIDTSTFGQPVGNWPTGGCNINTFFDPQELVFDITLCGDFAGNTQTFAATCTGQCYEDWVIGSPSNYDTAYFEVQFLRVYGTGEDTVIGSGAPRTGASWSAWAMAALSAGALVAWM